MSRIYLSPRDAARFEKYLKRDKETGCLLWTGARSPSGYGKFRLNGKHERAHRVAFIKGGGELTPEKPQVLHDCPLGDNPACCEFAHLRAGTQLENHRDKARKNRGTTSSIGMPYGVTRQRNNRFVAFAQGPRTYLGMFSTWQEAAALALYEKNRRMYPETQVN